MKGRDKIKRSKGPKTAGGGGGLQASSWRLKFVCQKVVGRIFRAAYLKHNKEKH